MSESRLSPAEINAVRFLMHPEPDPDGEGYHLREDGDDVNGYLVLTSGGGGTNTADQIREQWGIEGLSVAEIQAIANKYVSCPRCEDSYDPCGDRDE